MHRSRKILITCHCVLNANAKVYPLAAVGGTFSDVVSSYIEAGCGLFQLPCPELSYLGMNRWGMTKEQYDHPNFRFPITYAAARLVVKKAGNFVDIHLNPHDLRRHGATYASRSGTPLEIVSKVLLRHSNLSTTQRYLGKVSDVEAMQWIDKLHG